MYILFLIPLVLIVLPIIAIVRTTHFDDRIKSLENEIANIKKNGVIPKTTSEQSVQQTQTAPTTVTNQEYSIAKAPEYTSTPNTPVNSEDKSGKILGRIGIAAVLIGVAFFLKYAFNNNWIGPAGRVMLGIIAGLGFIGLGQYLRAKYLQYSDLIMGGGIAILYLSIFAAHSFYNLINSGMTGIFMFLVTLLAFAISITNSTQTLALVSTIGAFATPFMVGSNENAMLSLFAYLTIINAGVLGVSVFRKWPKLNIASFAGTAINFLAWYSTYYEADFLAPTLLFCIVTFIIFLIAQVIRAIVANVKSDSADYILIGANALSLTIIGYNLLNPLYHNVLGFSCVIVALIYMVFALLVNKSNPEDKALNIFLPGLAVVFLSMAVPMQFSGPWIAIAWFVEAAILYFIASMVANRGFQIMGLIVYILGLLDFFVWYGNHYDNLRSYIPFLNTPFIILLIAVIAAYFIAFIYNKYGSINLEIRKRGITAFIIIANILTIYALTIQITTYYRARSDDIRIAYEANRQNLDTYSNNYDVSDEAQISFNKYYRDLDRLNNISNTLVSILWTLYAMVLTTIGFTSRLASSRRLGLILFLITAFKVLIDVWSLGELYRIISFIAFGIIALLASFGYVKYKDRLKEIITILLFVGISSTMIFGLFGGVNIANADFNQTNWQYMRSITTPSSEGFVKALLPTDISWNTNRGTAYSDIRIIDGQGNEIPYLLNRDQSVSSPTISTRLLNLTTTNDGMTRFIADTNQLGVVYSGIDILAGNNSANFKRQVSVYSSNTLLPIDDSRWSMVTNNGFIFRITDPSTGSVSGKYSVVFPANTSRYLKIVIGSGPEGSVNVSSVNAYRDISIINNTETTNLSATVNNDIVKKTTDITIDLGAAYRLSNEVELNINGKEKNYIRRVVVAVSNDMNNWQNVGNSSISRISTSIFNGSSNIVSYEEQRSRYIRLSIVNDDNPPLAVANTVNVKIPVLALVFQNRLGSNYSLYYGNINAKKPQYDISQLSSYIDQNNISRATVGSEVVNPKYIAPKGPVVPFTERYKILLNIVLVILVVVLGGGVGWYLRKYSKGNRHSF